MSGLPLLVHAARKLRRQMSLPEVLLWRELRKRPTDAKFRRQHAIGDYVLDFYCAAAKLAVEIDGRTHDLSDQPSRDIMRDTWLATRGIRCIRIAAAAVLSDPGHIAEWLSSEASVSLDEPPLHHAKRRGPPPRSGEDQIVPCLDTLGTRA